MNFSGTDTFTYRASDGTAASNLATVTITVTPINDAPTIANGAIVTLAGTNEDTPSGATSVNGILTSASWADVDAGALKGIAVTSAGGNGTWQYSTDGVTWTAFGPVSSTSALLLTSTSQVRYVPDGQNGETVSFGFRAWDQTTGTASSNGAPSYASPDAGGGTTAWSTQSASARIVVSSLNDAPTIANGAVASLAGTNEDTTSSGTSVNGILTSTSGCRRGRRRIEGHRDHGHDARPRQPNGPGSPMKPSVFRPWGSCKIS